MQVISFRTLLLNYIKRHPVTSALLFANLFMFIFVLFNGGYPSNQIELASSLTRNGALVPILVDQGEYWRILTAMFLHAGFFHFFMNTFFLYYIGRFMERLLGSIKFGILYFASGIGSGLLVWWLSNENTATIGASGALYGIMAGLFLLTYIRASWFHPSAIRSIRFMVMINLFITFVSMIGNGPISVWGHAGGFAVGLLIIYFLTPQDPPNTKHIYRQQAHPESHHGRTIIDADSVTDDDIYDNHYTN